MTMTSERPTLATMRGHREPSLALYYGVSPAGPDAEGIPVTVRPVDGGWHVSPQGKRPWLVTSRQKLWLVPVRGEAGPTRPEQHVTNPSPVPLRLDTPTMGAYRYLAHVLTGAANAADTAAAAAREAGKEDDARTIMVVRDALRKAAVESLAPAGGTRTPRCRRCSIECPHCGGAQ